MEVLDLTVIKEKLQAAGYKLTLQRQMILSILVEKETEHLSAEEIYLLAKKKNTNIGLATVYRTLDILTDLDILYRVIFEDGLARYDIPKDTDIRFHHHLLCTTCGQIEEVHENLLVEVEKVVESKYHFKVQDHRLTFHGLCRQCLEKKELMQR